MVNVAILAPILNALFGDTAESLARQAGFIRRQGQITGHDFLKALVFGYLQRRDAPLEDLAEPLGVSRQALDQRFTAAAASFCRAVLLHAARHVLERRPEAPALLAGFNGVFLDDCTQAKLPDDAAEDFPGCGAGDGVRGKAAMKVLLRWEVQHGHVHHVGIHAASKSDHDALAAAGPLPAGCLHLADLGFADFARLRGEDEAGVSWITRLPAQTSFRPAGQGAVPLADHLRSARLAGLAEVDQCGEVGRKDVLPGRLVALACPPDVASRRLAARNADAKRRGVAVSERQREMCRWTVLYTNVPAQRLGVKQVWQVYRLRWQVELLFKRLKSEGGLDETSSGKRYRVECEWYAKLLGQLVRNWLQLLRGGPLRDVNAAQAGRTVGKQIQALLEALGDLAGVARVLARIEERLARLRKRTRRKKRKTVSQAIADHELAA